MCNFFSWISNGDERYYQAGVDSHSQLAKNHNWNEDKCNKFEYSKGVFKVDQINTEDNSKQEEYWISEFSKTREFQVLCLAAVKQNGYLLRYVKKQTSKICLEAVKQDGTALQFVKKQTPEIYLEAVKQSGYALEFVKKQTPELCLEAVKQSGYALEFVKKQTPEICLAAVKQSGYSLEFVKESFKYLFRRGTYDLQRNLD